MKEAHAFLLPSYIAQTPPPLHPTITSSSLPPLSLSLYSLCNSSTVCLYVSKGEGAKKTKAKLGLLPIYPSTGLPGASVKTFFKTSFVVKNVIVQTVAALATLLTAEPFFVQNLVQTVEQTGIFYVLYLTLLNLPALRFHCFGGCWDRSPGLLRLCHWQSDASNHSARSRVQLWSNLVLDSVSLFPLFINRHSHGVRGGGG